MNTVLYSVAGTSLAQAASSDVLRARQDAMAQQRGLEAAQQTEDASGIGKTDGEDNQTNERDADGRTPWRLGRQEPALPKEEDADDSTPEPAIPDASGERGGQLDLSG